MKVRQLSKQQSSLVGIILCLSTLASLSIFPTAVQARVTSSEEEVAKASGGFTFDSSIWWNKNSNKWWIAV